MKCNNILLLQANFKSENTYAITWSLHSYVLQVFLSICRSIQLNSAHHKHKENIYIGKVGLQLKHNKFAKEFMEMSVACFHFHVDFCFSFRENY